MSREDMEIDALVNRFDRQMVSKDQGDDSSDDDDDDLLIDVLAKYRQNKGPLQPVHNLPLTTTTDNAKVGEEEEEGDVFFSYDLVMRRGREGGEMVSSCYHLI